jgi:hypothetical protein
MLAGPPPGAQPDLERDNMATMLDPSLQISMC